ncbi:MAG: FMN-dependent NADH-azoreductase 1 [Paracidovorax wautersii]|uniref:FMN dependent NADH:quinone oxidoreductase n=1 Tax=Paracidovorax wautersii TaxID=1177982 RepID=A0A7V8FNE6_9BURK|nr:MAG: FMN-dependent NADH-azoreductase 1 [Paracidovorax wautersii]
MQVLHIDSSILGEASISRTLTALVVADLSANAPTAKVVYRDLVQEVIPHLDGPIAAGFRPLSIPAGAAIVAAEHARSEQLVTEFLASDVIVIGAPMYNFSVASQLKAWIDRIVQPGRTFKYTSTGPVGLAPGKRVIVVTTRGGAYTSGPLAPLDFQEPYLQATLGFMGVTDVRFIRAENLSKGEALAAPSISAARDSVRDATRQVLAT